MSHSTPHTTFSCRNDSDRSTGACRQGVTNIKISLSVRSAPSLWSISSIITNHSHRPPSYTDSAVSKTTVTKTMETMETVVMGVFSSVFSLLLRKEAACVLRACDIHNRIACQDKYYEPCRAGTVVVLIMINVGNNHLWNKSQLELNNAWGISFIEKQSNKSDQ